MTAPAFTAAQIAKVVGLTKRGVLSRLKAIAPDVHVIVGGQRTAAWLPSSLPDDWRSVIDAVSRTKLYRTPADCIADLVESPTGPKDRRGQPVMLQDVHPDAVEKARLLQRALQPALELQNDPRFTSTELQQRAVEGYRRVFGRKVSARYIRKLIGRINAWDSGAGQWARVGLYLPEYPRLKDNSRPLLKAGESDFQTLHDVIGKFADQQTPSNDEKALLWLRAMELFDREVKCGADAKELRLKMLAFLYRHARFLSAGENALRMMFDRKRAVLERAGVDGLADGLADGREKKRGETRAEPYDPDQVDLIKYTAATQTGGRRSQAARRLDEMGKITDPRIKHALDTASSKSYLPKSLRDELTDVPALRVCHIGPRATAKMVPPRRLTYEGIHSLDCVVADDKTLDVYVPIPNPDGWFDMVRPQLLALCDLISTYVLSDAFLPYSQYTALDTRTLYATGFAEHGLPKSVSREGGIWRKSALANSLGAIGQSASFSDAAVEFGLSRKGMTMRQQTDSFEGDLGKLGIRFREVYRARAKIIERVFGVLSDEFEGLPGYCGRNERVDCPEITTKNVARVRARQADPFELGFLSFPQLHQIVQRIIAKYNAEPQEGRRLRNPITGAAMSPEEAFQYYWNFEDPPARFDDDCRVLLSHISIPVEVKKPNLRRGDFPCGYVKIRGNTYCNEETGHRVGQKLIAWYNPELPETCTFTDMRRRNPFTVPLLKSTNAYVPNEQTRISSAQAAEPIAVIKAEFRAMKSKFEPIFRQNLVDLKTTTLNAHVETAAAEHSKQKHKAQTRGRAIQDKARRLGISGRAVANDPDVEEGLDLMARAKRAAHKRKEA